MSSAVDGLAGELVGGLEAQASVGAVAVVVPQPVAHGDGDVVVVVEPLGQSRFFGPAESNFWRGHQHAKQKNTTDLTPKLGPRITRQPQAPRPSRRLSNT